MVWTTSGLWPWRPALLPDETFSSWFARLAAGNGLYPAELYRLVKPGAHPRPRDLDRYVEPDLQVTLAERTGVDPEALRQATFIRWAGLVFEEDDGRNKLAWLPLAGTEDSKRSFGQQVCPACLSEDTVPYLRLSWRLGFVTACPRHRKLLIDRCTGCGEPVQILRTIPDKGVRCWKCGTDFARAPQDALPDASELERQQQLLDITATGWTSLGAYGPVYSFVYFRVLMLVFRLLATGRHADPLRTWIAARRGDSPPNVPRIKQVELLNTRCRHELLNMTAELLADWPNRFVDACRGVGVTNRHLIKGDRHYPFAFAHAVEWNLSETVRAVTEDEMRAGMAYLRGNEQQPTFRALVDLFGVKPTAHRSLAEPASVRTPYGQGRYWKLDGVSSDIRLAAREAANRSGESVAAWVEKALRSALESPHGNTTGA
ncbi:TniQ family protein [Azospirillum brasilense]|uniref:TniQ family protein n=1 Tax=Azospirillum brasilense TaxID=192 RepID=UPI001EDBBC05|nr:TniQ family protein [Azospirillum brasilense]UKJ73265.1 TniQ family protein [Azospirillum brasilense]UKJ75466.1 TniQ family protein [Azospirillum brasilense]